MFNQKFFNYCCSSNFTECKKSPDVFFVGTVRGIRIIRLFKTEKDLLWLKNCQNVTAETEQMRSMFEWEKKNVPD